MSFHCPACGKCWCCGRPLIEVQPQPWINPWGWQPTPTPFYTVTTTTTPEQPLPSTTDEPLRKQQGI